MKKILNVILPIALLALVYGFIYEMYFVQKVYEQEYMTRYSLFSSLLMLAFTFLVLMIGYGYSKTDRVRILDGIFGIIPSIILLIPVVCYFLFVTMGGSVGGWIINFLNMTGLSIDGVPLANVIQDRWQAFALSGLALLLAYFFRKRVKKEPEEEEEDDYLDDLPPVGEKKKKKKKEKAEEPAPIAAEPVEPAAPEAPAEPDPIYAEVEPEVIPEAPAAPEPEVIAEAPAPEIPEAPAPETPEFPEA